MINQVTIGVFAAVFDDENRILCVRQAYGPQRWTTPGGRLEAHEDPEAGVLRELHEETGYHGTVDRFLGTYYAQFKTPGDIVLSFQVTVTHRDPWMPNGEIAACDFFPYSDLPSPMSFNTQTRIGHAFNRIEPNLWVFDTADSMKPGALQDHARRAGR